jgi:PKD repeat protein
MEKQGLKVGAKIFFIIILIALLSSFFSNRVFSQCAAYFEADQTSGCAPLTVNFSDKSQNATEWYWSFEGGSPAQAQGQGPHQVIYNNPGTFDVTLKIVCQQGTDTKTIEDYIQVTDCTCEADFSAQPTSGCATLTVTYSDQSQNAASWQWTFPGGSPSSATGQGPHVVEYTNPGEYDAKLVVNCQQGSDTETKTKYITVNDCTCEADFVVDQTSGCAPLTVQFSDDSENATSWNWSFPGGSPSNATGQGPHNITYNNPGNYDVSLDIVCPYGNDSETKNNYIQINDCACEAEFYADQTSGCAPVTVLFVDESENATEWSWNFPGGTPSSAQGKGPHSITYDNPGSYDVTLDITCPFGTDSKTMNNYIQVNDCRCDADFVADQTSGCPPLTAKFTDNSTNATSWNWIFEGGSPSAAEGQGPHYVSYYNPAQRDVTLNISCPHGSDSETKNNYIQINDCTCEANFIGEPTSGVAPLTVKFSDLSQNASSWNWSFPGGEPSSGQGKGPHYITYNDASNYSASLEITCPYNSDTMMRDDYIFVESPVFLYDYGDAPEGVLAYPSSGTMGAFPTCEGVVLGEFIRHGGHSVSSDISSYLGLKADYETEGNEGWCPTFKPDKYDQDESCDEADGGLLKPDAYTIAGSAGSESVTPLCELTADSVLGRVCRTAQWGRDIDIVVNTVNPTGAYVNVLIDWNQDGVWGDSIECTDSTPTWAREHVLKNFHFSFPPTGDLSTYSPPDFRIGPNSGYVWARFTLTEVPIELPWDGSGKFNEGETEDYLLKVQGVSDLLDFGDAPLSYGTMKADSGACHIIDPAIYLGESVDDDPDGQPDAKAMGDDNDGNDDEDGVIFPDSLVVGEPATIQIIASVSGYLKAWVDFNQDGEWNDIGEMILNTQAAPGENTFQIIIPNDAAVGNTCTRFRFSTNVINSSGGTAKNGEVEDYFVDIRDYFEREFGDAPDGALAYPSTGQIGNFPTCEGVVPRGYVSHGTRGTMYLGKSVDFETGGNAGLCPAFNPNLYDQDELYSYEPGYDEDAGIIEPLPFKIVGDVGSERISSIFYDHRQAIGPAGNWAEWGQNIDINYKVTGSEDAYINVLIDWNQDGNWSGSVDLPDSPGESAPEHVLVNHLITTGHTGRIGFAPPARFRIGPNPGFVWVRFTISNSPVEEDWNGSGYFSDGETEDYLLRVNIPEATADFGDAPEGVLAYPSTGAIGNFPTCREVGVLGNIQHGPGQMLFFGMERYRPDRETDGNGGLCPTFNPGQYNNDFDYGIRLVKSYTIEGMVGSEHIVEESLTSFNPNEAIGRVCQMATWGVDINLGFSNFATAAYVNVLFDWNQDGEWSGSSACSGSPSQEAPEHVLINFPIPTGFHTLGSSHPPAFRIGQNKGYVWARFTISDTPVDLPWNGEGYFYDGETIDYLLKVHGIDDLLDFGDAPLSYGTMKADNGASHLIDPVIFLGENIDDEPDGQPDVNAEGDDKNGIDDEDGVKFGTSLEPGKEATINVSASTSGLLYAWIDFNADTSWDDAGEEIFSDRELEAGENILTFTVPSDAVPGNTYARFRFSDVSGLFFDGPPTFGEQAATPPAGEVEDYLVKIENGTGASYDFGDAPEGALAYPSRGIIGKFPTCKSVGPNGFIKHDSLGTMFFGEFVDFESDGNGGVCPAFNPDQYDSDEFFDGRGRDGGLASSNFTIRGEPGLEEIYGAYRYKYKYAIGVVCQLVKWDWETLDIFYNVTSSDSGYINVLIDWNFDGEWGGFSDCPEGPAHEHILVNFPAPSGSGLLSDLSPPPFRIGSDSGYVWVRFTISERPVALPWDGSGHFNNGETEDHLVRVLGSFEVYDFGDAPEDVLAYPSSGVIGLFPTCKYVGPNGYVQHGPDTSIYIGNIPDRESDGNAGFCPFFNPNHFEMDSEAHIRIVQTYKIEGPIGSESVVLDPSTDLRSNPNLGDVCQFANFGEHIDFSYTNHTSENAYLNMLFDWNKDGEWFGSSSCPGSPSGEISEHVMINFSVPPGHDLISNLSPPAFPTGPDSGYVWARISMTERPVELPWDGSGIFATGETFDRLFRIGGLPVYVELEKTAMQIPKEFQLKQNYPNPFNPETTIEFNTPQAAHVLLRIYDLQGSEVQLVLDETVPAGLHRIKWDALNESGQKVSSGIYLYRIEAVGKENKSISFADVKKMILMK